jgi:long-chain acyl-CoA synthetase
MLEPDVRVAGRGAGASVRSRPVNLVELLTGTGEPDAVALRGSQGSTTYRDLGRLAIRMARLLAEHGVAPGDRVGLASTNDEAFVAAYLGTLHAGAIAVPLNPMAPPAELERELTMVEPALVLAAGPAIALSSAAGARVVPVRLADLPADDRGDAPDPVERSGDDVAVLLFTSGTAGAPKAAMLTHDNLAANVRQVLDHPGLRIHAEDRVLAALPFHHVFGLNVVLGVSLAAGASLVFVDTFDPVDVAAVVRDCQVSVIAGVPTMYGAWLAAGGAIAANTFGTVRLAVSGAAPLPPETAEGFRARFGIVVHQGYGLTEASPIVTSTALQAGAPVPGVIGPPLPGVEVRLVDGDGTDVLVGDPGEIWVRGPNVFPGYWHDPDATARALTPDGWLRTGDVALVESDGDLRLVDRAKDLVIVSGFNVYPVEVEQVLRDHDDVADAAVIGEPSPRTGETVIAYVVAVPGRQPDPDALRVHCAHHLARYKCPTRIEVVDDLPRSLAGKLVRRELRN